MHNFTRLKVGDQEADIDNDLVPIIQFLWKKGIKTASCCQGLGGKEKAIITFRNADEVKKFMELFFTKEQLTAATEAEQQGKVMLLDWNGTVYYVDERSGPIFKEYIKADGAIGYTTSQTLEQQFVFPLDEVRNGVLGWATDWKYEAAYCFGREHFVIHFMFPSEKISLLIKALIK